jgi:hypothetical protein
MAAKKVGGGKTPPKPTAKKTPAKKVAAKKPLTAYQKAVMGPAKSAGKGKLQPYNAAWRAEVKRKNDKYDKSVFKRVVEPASSIFGPMAAIKYGAEAITGKNLDAPAGSNKKVNRLSAAGSAAFAMTPLKGVRAAYRTVKGVKESTKTKPKPKTNVKTKAGATVPQKGKAAFDGYVNNMVNAELKKYYAAQAKAAKSKTKKK